MPRPKKAGAPEPKKRSRNGCWPCKARKVKCGEEKPRCLNCERQGETCDYSIRLNWGGRSKKGQSEDLGTPEPPGSALSSYFPTPEELIGSPTPSVASLAYSEPDIRTNRPRLHHRSRSNLSMPPDDLPDLGSPYLSRVVPTSAPTGDTNFREHGSWAARRFGSPVPQLRREVTSNPIMGDPRMDMRASPSYPSPTMSALQSPHFVDGVPPPNMGYNEDTSGLPPFRTIGSASPTPEDQRSDAFNNQEHQSKKMRFSPSNDLAAVSPFQQTSLGQASMYSQAPLGLPNPAAFGFNFNPTPLTPGDVAGDFSLGQPSSMPPGLHHNPQEPRRLSVNDLLSAPPEDVITPETPDSWPLYEADTVSYGYDLGQPDEDVPKNDDANAIMVCNSPEAKRLTFPPDAWNTDGQGEEESEEKNKPQAFNRGGYYAKPVAIRIPKVLEPLPSKLLENPMNLLYFHHFLNHTARILVPHDCEQNPFRNILPQMAVQNDNILKLMLTYSASHRARLLQHKEPGNRIAEYVQDVFPQLRQALVSPDHQVSVSDLGSAIMLASLEILSPNTFDVPISWQNHLGMAREMIAARGGLQSVHRHDKAAFFLSRWFVYLDVLGSLSGRKNDWPLASSYWEDAEGMEDEFQIDCLLGFTSRCVGILARISELARACERERLDAATGEVNPAWRPSGDVVRQAEELKRQLQQSRGHVTTRTCSHRRPSTAFPFGVVGGGLGQGHHAPPPVPESELAWDSLEIYATNEAFHWAGLIHLTRRVLGRPSNDPEVQNAVREIVGALYKVRRGGTAEACLLFPMFTAGCDAIDPGQRAKIAERLKGVEGFGMQQVHKARELMEKVWASGKPWESLVEGEFFG